MNTIGTWTARAASVTALSTAALLGFAGLAHADEIRDTIADDGSGVVLEAGSSTVGTAAIKLVPSNAGSPDPDGGCNIDKNEAPLKLDILTPDGVTANPDPLEITSCGAEFTVSFKASETAKSGTVTVSVISGPDGGGTYDNNVSIPITVTQPAPTNTAPSVSVQGVTNDATYESDSVPPAACDVIDKEDGNSTPAPQISGTLPHGIGAQTVTCSYTDEGGLSDSDSVTYTIVDTKDPTITYTLTPTAPTNGWFNKDVLVDFECVDNERGSGISSCTGDTTLNEGANQSVTGTATDWAGNTKTATTDPAINIDKTAPNNIEFAGGPASRSTYYGESPAGPTGCTATDSLSGLASCTVTGGGTTVGTHTYTATATDKAGNTTTRSQSYTVNAWTLDGFTAPVDMNGVWNTVKGGSTVPMKFEVFAGTTEKTDTAVVKSFTTKAVTCPGSTAPVDDIELTTTGGTALRYDTTGGQFIQNWQTPKKPGTCAQTTVTTQDGSTITANFMLK